VTMQEETSCNLGLEKIRESLKAQIVVGDNLAETCINAIYASDLMSDVLAYGKPGSVLLTGLNSIQAAISSYMAEFKAIIFLRGKNPAQEIRKFAQDKGLIVMTTDADMYEACVKIAGIESRAPAGIPAEESEQTKQNVTTHKYTIEGRDFASAGMVSTQIKAVLKSIGYDPQLIRRVAISTYEGEMNVVMHAIRAAVTLMASDKEIIVIIDDEGKGIPDIDMAMQEGFSTATEDQRALGFGAGMGLPNIKKNSDVLNISSIVAKGTVLETRFFVT
jgi:anti-sigma regulatory factor (Ser/Thr protein kinase)